ncbi:primosomal protein N' [Paenibacillus thermoaerophilus]|uniref:Replication restart protein PriA n=1 Tax=Paenibacillus thermoaerophilus TaxID=1215385 RepID=A0ABW2V1B0_9BACL|nr:primosomal protein N' [Paenibacillus thermoaerophilus]TMV19150.1 primosomal protein N' [Paenibacillus thermoaerophilus]
MFARVIVDVPSRQTDRPFDYRVPAHLRDWIGVGSRVEVPFGPRMLQGIVTELRSDTDQSLDKLKPVSRVLDPEPALTPELVELAFWMSGTYVCPVIGCLTAMLPGAIKAKERRVLVAVDGFPGDSPSGLLPDQEAVLSLARSRGGVTAEQLMERGLASAETLRDLLRRGWLRERREVKDQLKAKKQLFVRRRVSEEELRDALAGLPARSTSQRRVLEAVMRTPEPVAMADIAASLQVSPQTVRALAAKGWLDLEEREVYRDPYASRTFAPTAPLPLTEEQAAALGAIEGAVRGRTPERFLLHGVTGSGKTEVYLQAIAACLDMGREAIVLVPEIALTPQMVERFKGRFGARVAVLHSRLSQGERYDEWRKIARGEACVAVGARSAVFAPFTNLGLVIIDEEHEASYKQDESPKYHAAEIAAWRCRQHGAPLVLGSATPSMETYFAASPRDGRRPSVRLLRMPTRVNGRPLPPVHIVDLREELRSGNRSMFSNRLRDAIAARLERREQAVLFLNRRGYATFVMCRSCGYVAGCPHCDISLTYHQRASALRCHYCGHAERLPLECPDCGSSHIRHFGTGTQRVEEELGRAFPGIRVIRMDVDTTGEKGAHERLLDAFKSEKADVLLGTQMVAKGLDFPKVTLVGVVTADTMLNIPDFRSAERSFQLLTQVAGRAGRHEWPGEVIIQTYTPEHYAVRAAAMHDYEGFAAQELQSRRLNRYPPYAKLALVSMSHETPATLLRIGERLAALIRERAGAAPLELMGPVASPIPRIKDRYRFQILLKFAAGLPVSSWIAGALNDLEETIRREKPQIAVDMNPHTLL